MQGELKKVENSKEGRIVPGREVGSQEGEGSDGREGRRGLKECYERRKL